MIFIQKSKIEKMWVTSFWQITAELCSIYLALDNHIDLPNPGLTEEKIYTVFSVDPVCQQILKKFWQTLTQKLMIIMSTGMKRIPKDEDGNI